MIPTTCKRLIEVDFPIAKVSEHSAKDLAAATDAAQAGPEETAVVVDPFAGGGSIPLQALRLGCEAFASDLNPVACLILKTLLEDIPRYGNAEFRFKKPRMNTNEHESEEKKISVHSCSFVVEEDEEVVVQGLANALRYVGKRFERLALSLNALHPDGSDERRMLEGVRAAMRGIK
jgi:adenine-specific DNA methylase